MINNSRRRRLKQLAGSLLLRNRLPWGLLAAAGPAMSPAAQIPTRAAPGRLLCNLLPRPIGVTADNIRLSWEMPVLGPGCMQDAYQVQIAETAHGFEAVKGIVWDSGKMRSAESTAVPMPPKLLREDRVYYWRVRLWGTTGGESAWSVGQRIVTAAPGQWESKPIWARAAAQANGSELANWMLARLQFDVSGDIDAAWLKTSGVSPEKARQFVYRCFLNGDFVGLGPVRSARPKEETPTHCFDVTAKLRQGANVLSALCYAAEGKAFIAELTVKYRDGRSVTVGTGSHWRVADGGNWRPGHGTTQSGYYAAPQEHIDARQEPVGWTHPGFDDRGWEPALERPALVGLTPAQTENVEQQVLRPVATKSLGPGRWLFDLGQVVVGGIRLSAKARGAEELDIYLGEELNADGGARYQLRCGQVFAEKWTLRAGPQVLEHWGYRAFRWIEVRCPDLDAAPTVEALVLKLPWEQDDASFSSSDRDLDRVWEMCRYSIEALRLDLYQDTPNRERGPYEGDAIINQLSEYAVQRSYALARYSTHFLLHRPTWPTEYRLQAPILAWRDYLATNDPSALAHQYDRMVEMQLTGQLNGSGLVEKAPGQSSKVNGDLVDWPKSNLDDYVFTPVNTVINAWQYLAFTCLGQIAGVLGKEDDRTRFSTLASRLAAAMNTTLLREDGSYRDGVATEHCAQHATAFPLAFGVTPPAFQSRAGRNLAAQGMRSSVYGAQFLLDALFLSGQEQAGLRLLESRDMFSWLHMIDDLHATIAMEAWDPSIKPNTTFCHAWGTAPANVIPRHVVGVEVIRPGASEISIAPKPGNLDWFRAVVPTIRGGVRVEYHRAGPNVLDVDVPPNVVARLDLSGLERAIGKALAVETRGYTAATSNTGSGSIAYLLRPGRATIVRA